MFCALFLFTSLQNMLYADEWDLSLGCKTHPKRVYRYYWFSEKDKRNFSHQSSSQTVTAIMWPDLVKSNELQLALSPISLR